MRILNVPKITSDRFALKAENTVLWVLLVIANAVIAFQMWEHDQLKSRITPQAIYDACNGGNK